MEQVYQCWCRICREINVFFPDLNITCLWPIYWLSLMLLTIEQLVLLLNINVWRILP
jgi:hypothetical protein